MRFRPLTGDLSSLHIQRLVIILGYHQSFRPLTGDLSSLRYQTYFYDGLVAIGFRPLTGDLSSLHNIYLRLCPQVVKVSVPLQGTYLPY